MRLKLSVLKQLTTEKATSLSAIQVLDRLNKVLAEENTRAEAILETLKNSTDVLTNVGLG